MAHIRMAVVTYETHALTIGQGGTTIGGVIDALIRDKMDDTSWQIAGKGQPTVQSVTVELDDNDWGLLHTHGMGTTHGSKRK